MERYLIALGSNQRHGRHGRPSAVLRAALRALADKGVAVEASSKVMHTAPLGPSLRRYANAAAVVASPLDPDAMLDLLHDIEHDFGRRRMGSPWRSRVLDLDIILWSGGPWAAHDVTIPHIAFRTRDFVLRPAATIAGHWRDPLTGLTLRHLEARLTRRAPKPIAQSRKGALSSVGRATDF